MAETTKYVVDPEVTFQELGDETVLVHLTTGKIHHTNATGGRVWALLQEGLDTEEILDRLQGEYESTSEKLRADVEGFIQTLATEKIIQNADPAS
jgi:hypothetical protein